MMAECFQKRKGWKAGSAKDAHDQLPCLSGESQSSDESWLTQL